MAFTIRLCPYCGGEISADDPGSYSCLECGKRTYRSRSNTKAFLDDKPYEDEYGKILLKAESDPKAALSMIEQKFEESDEPDSDMYFVRGNIHSALGEEGKAHNDWKKGLDLLTDMRPIDAYITAICKRIVDLTIEKEREFLDFNPMEYIDLIATEFALKAEVPCKGVFYITIYRNFRMKLLAGELEIDDDIYPTLIPQIIDKIIAYGRNFKTIVNIIDEVLDDFHYNNDTYEEDDNLKLHACFLIRNAFVKYGENYTDEHLSRIMRHWNDENMFELEYWADELMKSTNDKSILQTLRKIRSDEEREYDIEEAVDDYVKKYLLLSDDGKDLSEEA